MAKNEKEKKPISKKKRRKIVKIIISLVIITALVVCGIIFIPRFFNANNDSESTLQKRTATVFKGDVIKTIGSSAPLESSETLVYKPDISGEIVDILVEEGDLVKSGDTIMTIDTSNTDESIESLNSQIENKADQIADKEDMIDDKYKAIKDRQDDIEDKKDDISDLQDEISSIEDEITENESSRSNLNIYAPINGTIFNVNVSVGDNVTGNTSFATITNTKSYRVELPFTAKILDEEIKDIKIFYKNNRLDSEIVSIAGYTYKDKLGNEMVDVLISFTTDIALPEKDVVEGIIYLEFLSYHSTSDKTPYYADTQAIKTDIPGEILELYLSEKQSVNKGDLIAVIDGESIDNTENSLNKQIESLEKQIASTLDVIETYYENIDSYYEDISDLNDEISDFMEDIADLEAAIEEEKQGYEEAVISADFDGIVTNLKVSVADSVGPNTTLFTLVSLNNPSMVVAVDELDIDQLKIGQEAVVVIDALTATEETPVKAIVTKIAMQGNYQGGVSTFNVTVMLLDPVEGLKLTMNATATIYIDKSEDTLYIPIEAVTISGNRRFVYVQDLNATDIPTVADSAMDNTTVRIDANATGRQASGTRTPGGNINPENMTDEQKAALQERLSSMGMSMDDVQGQTATITTAVDDETTYYTGTRIVEVTTGIYNELYIEILEGLQAGDVVVLPPLYSSTSSETTAAKSSGMLIPGISGTGTGGGQRPTGGFGGN